MKNTPIIKHCDSVLEPKFFLYGDTAKKAIEKHVALPFLGKKMAFVAVNDMVSQEIININSLNEDQKLNLKHISTPLPLAGLPEGSLVMGILNVTPDSFSDGGKYYGFKDAVSGGHQMIAQGAAILDIGGESTRPGSQSITSKEECERILPVIKALKGCGGLISVDTRHAETMKYALDAGADIINDISALNDPESAHVIAQANCPVMLMHMRGNPQTMGQYAEYKNVALEVMSELNDKIHKAESAGIRRENIILDPGIGFAKDRMQNIELLQHFSILAYLGCRLMLAVSRKRFIRQIMNDPSCDNYDYGTIIASMPIFGFGSEIIRVHNVPAMVQSLKVWQALHLSET